jgi:hypothetical protein
MALIMGIQRDKAKAVPRQPVEEMSDGEVKDALKGEAESPAMQAVLQLLRQESEGFQDLSVDALAPDAETKFHLGGFSALACFRMRLLEILHGEDV